MPAKNSPKPAFGDIDPEDRTRGCVSDDKLSAQRDRRAAFHVAEMQAANAKAQARPVVATAWEKRPKPNTGHALKLADGLIYVSTYVIIGRGAGEGGAARREIWHYVLNGRDAEQTFDTEAQAQQAALDFIAPRLTGLPDLIQGLIAEIDHS